MSIVVGGLLGPAVVTSGYFDVLSDTLETTELTFYVHLQASSKEVRTGVLGEQVTGFLYDKTLFQRDYDQATHYGNSIQWAYSISEGVPANWWQAASYGGLDYKDTVIQSQGTKSIFLPRVLTGHYALDDKPIPLYSDWSGTKVLDSSDTASSLARFPLDGDEQGEFYIATWRRDSDFVSHPDIVWTILWDDETFTGALNYGTNTRANAEPSGVPTYANMDHTVFEAKVQFDDDRILLNGPAIFTVGNLEDYDPVTHSISAIEYNWESHGTNSAGRLVFSKHFPIVGDIRVYIIDGTFLTELTEVDDIWLADETDEVFSIQRATGRIYLGGYQNPDAVLGGDIDNSVQTILLSYTTDISSLPSRGTITIGTEEIVYNGTSGYYLLNCERGANSTSAASHTAGDIITFTQQGAFVEGNIYISYEYGPRLDYEISTHDIRSCNYGSWYNSHPSARVDPNGILQLKAGEIHVASLELEIDADEIAEDYWGPIRYGRDSALVTARALDSSGAGVNEIDITIQVLDGPGLLDNTTSITDESNSRGEIYSIFYAPFSQDEVEKIASSTTHSSGDTLMVVPDLIGSETPSEIYVFQILKHDPIFGTVGIADVVAADPVATSGNETKHGEYYLDVETDVFDPDEYIGGSFKATDTDENTYERVITHLYIVEETASGAPHGLKYARIFFNTEISLGAETLEGEDIYILPAGAVDWDPDNLNGVRVILYEDASPSGRQPVTPDSIDGTTLTFSSKELPLPNPDDPTNNIGGYLVISFSNTRLRASCLDPATGQVLYSNIVTVRTTLPESMIGIVDGDFDGFTVSDTDGAEASGLGGANFITINPRATGINRVNILATLS